MLKSWSKFLSTAIVFALIVSFFTPAVVGAKVSTSEQKEIQKVAEQLEFIFEEAITKNENGEIIGVDVDKIEAKYGSDPLLDKVRKEQEAVHTMSIDNPALVPTYSQGGPIATLKLNSYNRCVEAKVISNFGGDWLPGTVVGTVISLAVAGEYYDAASKLVKAGIKMSIPGIVGMLGWIISSCTWQQDNY